MKSMQAQVWLLVLQSLRFSIAWEVDPRCPLPGSRTLQVAKDDSSLSGNGSPIDGATAFLKSNSHTSVALRGTMESATDAMSSRALTGPPSVFSLKMHWEEGYCWQEEYSLHRKWCWECKEGCKARGTLWWQTCDGKSDQKFTYLADSEGGRFKTAYHNLCLHRVSNTQYVLKECSSDKAQIIVGVRMDGEPFELSPLGNSSLCINQAHHPKAGEIVENTICKISRHWHTNLMEFYNFNNDPDHTLRLRSTECSNEDPCNQCQGDCDNDDQCLGADLVCFQRDRSSMASVVPGCKGVPVADRDYCIRRKSVPAPPPSSTPALPTTSPNNRIPLNARIRNCTKTSKCNRCEGDCDVDLDCVPGLKCFQKDGPAEIPGCLGVDESRTDFCYLP